MRYALLTVIASLAVASACDSKSRGESRTAASADQETSGQTPPAQAATRAPEEASAQPPRADDLHRFTQGIEGEGPLWAHIETSTGEIACRLHEDRTPMTVANFVGLARGLKAWVDPEADVTVQGRPFYDGVIIHRVIPEFMIQTGDRTGTGRGGPGYTFPDEFVEDLRHDKPGVMSMANRGPDTNGSQFFIIERATPHLDFRHTVFGQCEPIELIRAIARVPADAMDRPNDPPVIKKIRFERHD